MSIAEFLIECRDFGVRVALHNVLWLYVHRHDATVFTVSKEEFYGEKRP